MLLRTRVIEKPHKQAVDVSNSQNSDLMGEQQIAASLHSDIGNKAISSQPTVPVPLG